MDLVYWPVVAAARGLFALQGTTFSITGAQNIPDSGGAVLALNHTSYLDFAHAGVAALPKRRLIRYMAKEPIFAHPVAGPLMRAMKHISVDREAGASAYRNAVAALRSGELVGVYPEATISRSFEIKDLKLGAARMALEAQVPIVPIVLWGSHRIWSKGLPRRLGRTRIPVHIAVGEPIHVPPGSDPKEVTARLRETMTSMLASLRGGYPPLDGSQLRYLPASMGGTAPTLEEASRLDAADAAERVRRRREAAAGSGKDADRSGRSPGAPGAGPTT